VLAPAIATRAVAVALPLLIVGAILLGAPNPPLDAARLDIMPPGLRGRAGGAPQERLPRCPGTRCKILLQLLFRNG
jgi:hypothetical protein